MDLLAEGFHILSFVYHFTFPFSDFMVLCTMNIDGIRVLIICLTAVNFRPNGFPEVDQSSIDNHFIFLLFREIFPLFHSCQFLPFLTCSFDVIQIQ